jgi:hypothetical protein
MKYIDLKHYETRRKHYRGSGINVDAPQSLRSDSYGFSMCPVEEREPLLLSVRSLFGDDAYRKILSNPELVYETLLAQHHARVTRPSRSKVPNGFCHLTLQGETDVERRRAYFKNRLHARVESGVHRSVGRKVDVQFDYNIVRDGAPGSISLNVGNRPGRYSFSPAQQVYKVDLKLPNTWINSPAPRLMETLNATHFILECKRAPEFDTPGYRYFWYRGARAAVDQDTNRPTSYNPVEELYAVLSDDGKYHGHGSSSAKALYRLERMKAIEAKNRMLGKHLKLAV